jgi:hypothetical protein
MGQVFGFVLCLLALGGGLYLLINDKTLVGLVALVPAIGALAGSMMRSKK